MSRPGEDLLWRHDAGWRTFGIDSIGELHEVVGVGPLRWRRSRVPLTEATTARVWFLDETLELQLEFADDTYLHFRFSLPQEDVQREAVAGEVHVSQLAAALRSFVDDVRTPSHGEFDEQDEPGTDADAGQPEEADPTPIISAEDVDSWSFGTVEGGYRVESVEALLERAVETLRSYQGNQPGDRISSDEVRSAVFETATEGYVWQEVDEIIERVAATLAFYETRS